jgi:hypothetical protein
MLRFIQNLGILWLPQSDKEYSFFDRPGYVTRSNKKWENGTFFVSNRLRSKSSEWPAWRCMFLCIDQELSILNIILWSDKESCPGGSLQGLSISQLYPWVHLAAHVSPIPLAGQREVTSAVLCVLRVMAQEQEWLLWPVNVGWKQMCRHWCACTCLHSKWKWFGAVPLLC